MRIKHDRIYKFKKWFIVIVIWAQIAFDACTRESAHILLRSCYTFVQRPFYRGDPLNTRHIYSFHAHGFQYTSSNDIRNPFSADGERNRLAVRRYTHLRAHNSRDRNESPYILNAHSGHAPIGEIYQISSCAPVKNKYEPSTVLNISIIIRTVHRETVTVLLFTII